MHFFNRRFFMLVLGFFLAGIVLAAAACALAPSPDMKSLTWLPRFVARWADAEPTFRNFPAFAALAFVATLFFFLSARSVTADSAFYAMFLVSIFSITLELVQLKLPGRFFDPLDIAWSITGSFAGSSAGFFLGLLLAALFSRRG
jgi:VanZ family protein